MRPRRSGFVRALATVLSATFAVLWLAAGEAAAADLSVVAVGKSRTDGRVSVVVDVRSAASSPIPARAFSVTARGTPVGVQAVPLFSDQLAIGVVVDASEAGRPALHAGLAGATNFLLEQPRKRTVVVADRSPPVFATLPETGTTDLVKALSGIQPGGQRQTSAAISLALRDLGAMSANSRMVLLYTAAADAGGEPAADLAARLIDAHTFLAVVSTGDDPGYWIDVTQRSGGTVARPQAGGIFAAFDHVADETRGLYLLTFPAPDPLPVNISVAADTAEGPVSADAVLPSPTGKAIEPGGSTASDPDRGPDRPLILVLVAAAGCILYLVGFRLARHPSAGVSTDSIESADSAVTAGSGDGGDTADAGDIGPPAGLVARSVRAPRLTGMSRLGRRPHPPGAKPPPPPGLVTAAPEQDHHDVDPDDDQQSCMCGCGIPVRPGRAFVSQSHQARWMS